MMHEVGHGMGRVFFPGFGVIIQLIFLVIFIVIVVWLLKSGHVSSGERESAKDVLDKRLARGEIEVKEYKKLLEEIRGK